MADDEPTFDLSIPDCTAEGIGAILGGLGLAVMHAERHGAGERAKQAADVNDRLMRENREAVRYLLLESDVGQHIELVGFPDDLLDDLGIGVVEGQAVDAADVTHIDIE